MTRTSWLSTLICISGVAVGCSNPDAIVAEGCLMQSGDRFVLTDLSPSDSRTAPSSTATTTAYELVGDDDELRQHVGKQVGIIGEAEESTVAEIREITPDTPAATSGDAGVPEVETSSQMRVAARKVNVSSVTATGQACETR